MNHRGYITQDVWEFDWNNAQRSFDMIKEVYKILQIISNGKVVTYGQIAAMP